MKTLLTRSWIFGLSLVLSLAVIRREPPHFGLALSADRIKQAEFFPFSSFPMYSGFSPRPFVVYIADGEGQPLASLHEFGVRTSVLKKDYERRLKQIKKETGIPLQKLTPEHKRPAGEATLAHLLDALDTRQRRGHLQLWEITLTRENGEVVHRPLKVAEIRRPS